MAGDDCETRVLTTSISDLTGMVALNYLTLTMGSFYFIATEASQPADMYIMRIQTDNSAMISRAITCPTASCTLDSADFELEDAARHTHVVAAYNSQVLFFTMDDNTGNQIGTLQATSTSLTCSGSVQLQMTTHRYYILYT